MSLEESSKEVMQNKSGLVHADEKAKDEMWLFVSQQRERITL